MRKALLLVLPCFALSCLPPAPIHPRALESNNLCAQYLNGNDLEKAEIECDHGLEFSPNYADLWVNKGLIAYRRNQIDAAKQDFEKALRLNNEQAQAYSNLGVIYFKDHKYGTAHDMFQRALKVNPDYLEARYDLALCFKEMGEKAKARKEYHTILAVNPNVADAHHDLGVMALEEHAYEEAIDELQKATQLDGKFEEAWQDLARTYLEAGRFADAKDAYVSCLSVNPNNVVCRNDVTIATRKAALQDPALQELKSEGGGENTPAALFARGQTLGSKGLKDDEKRQYLKCVRLDSHYAPCHYGLYLLYKEDHDDKGATVACKNFLKFAVADEFPREVEACEKYVSANSY